MRGRTDNAIRCVTHEDISGDLHGIPYGRVGDVYPVPSAIVNAVVEYLGLSGAEDAVCGRTAHIGDDIRQDDAVAAERDAGARPVMDVVVVKQRAARVVDAARRRTRPGRHLVLHDIGIGAVVRNAGRRVVGDLAVLHRHASCCDRNAACLDVWGIPI